MYVRLVVCGKKDCAFYENTAMHAQRVCCIYSAQNYSNEFIIESGGMRFESNLVRIMSTVGDIYNVLRGHFQTMFGKNSVIVMLSLESLPSPPP
jgi:hypothetical protein